MLTTAPIPEAPQRLESLSAARTWYPYVWAADAGPMPDAHWWPTPVTPSADRMLDDLQQPRALAVVVKPWPDLTWRLVASAAPNLAPNALDPADEPSPTLGRSVWVVADVVDKNRQSRYPATLSGWLDCAAVLLQAAAVVDAIDAYAANLPAPVARPYRAEQAETREWLDTRWPTLQALARPWWPSFVDGLKAGLTKPRTRAVRLRA